MDRSDFIKELLKLLVKIDGGMVEFSEPLPQGAAEGLVSAIASFGEEALPELHRLFADLPPKTDFVYVIDVLGEIGSPLSAPFLIEYHSHYASYISGTAAIQALKKISTEPAYLYLGNLLIQYTSGKPAFNTGAEIPVACEALGEWNDDRAIGFLEQATRIHDPNRMPVTAIEQLAKYPQAHPFLSELAQSNPLLKVMIENALNV